jgi:hypothetical protein
MISKTRKNCKNKISKTRKISGGGKIFDWNLGPIILKKEKGYFFSDTYWIEYPTDSIENGWTQIVPTPEDPLPKYICSTTIEPPKEGYSWVPKDDVHNSMILNEIITQRPLPNGSFVSKNCKTENLMCTFDYLEHNNKLSQQKWQKTAEIPNTRIKGKKEFIRNFHTLYVNKKYKGISEELNRRWIIKELYYLFKKLLLSYDIKSIPSEFIDLYNDVKNDIWHYDFFLGTQLEQIIKKEEQEKKILHNPKSKTI